MYSQDKWFLVETFGDDTIIRWHFDCEVFENALVWIIYFYLDGTEDPMRLEMLSGPVLVANSPNFFKIFTMQWSLWTRARVIKKYSDIVINAVYSLPFTWMTFTSVFVINNVHGNYKTFKVIYFFHSCYNLFGKQNVFFYTAQNELLLFTNIYKLNFVNMRN